MKFLRFCKLVCNTSELIEYLREEGVLRRTINCDRCDMCMTTNKYSQWLDGICFRCSACRTRKSIRCASFLVDCRISLQNFASMLFLLNAEVPYKCIAETLELEDDTVTNYANLIREERGKYLIDHGEMLGGPGRRVQVGLFTINIDR